MQCYPLRFQLSCGKSVKYRFIEFFVFDHDSLPYYRQRMQRGNVFLVSVYLTVGVSVRAVTFEADGIETFFLA